MVGIRLIKQNSEIVNIDAIDFTLDFKKSVTPFPLPHTGERTGFDNNRVSAVIRVNAILRDDDCSGLDPTGNAAEATLDFSSKAVSVSTTEDAASNLYLSADGGDVPIADLNGKQFKVQSTHLASLSSSTTIFVKFDTSTTSNSVSGMTLTVGISGITTGAEVATKMSAAMTTHTGTFSTNVTSTGGNTFGSAFTVSIINGFNASVSGIKLVQKEAGAGGNTPIHLNLGEGMNFRTTGFSGGSGHNCKSAGDKAQDLIANVANSNVTGAMGAVIRTDATDPESGLGQAINYTSNTDDDYIIGIQIPYNSLVQSDLTSTDPDGYAVRNFLIITGAVTAIQQGSSANNLPASSTFDFNNKMTGISGTVVGVTLTYDAGETIYGATIDFQPLDFIAGL